MDDHILMMNNAQNSNDHHSVIVELPLMISGKAHNFTVGGYIVGYVLVPPQGYVPHIRYLLYQLCIRHVFLFVLRECSLITMTSEQF